MSNLTAFILGYTGAIGKEVVLQLARDKAFSRIVLVGRREVQLPAETDDRFVQKIVNYDEIEKYEDVFAGCQVGFCCLGTIRSRGGAAGVVRVDRDYVLKSAAVAKTAGCTHFQLVSSVGANHNSCFLYTKTKGEAEEGLKATNFNRLSIYRPSLLLADREEIYVGESFTRCMCWPVIKLFPTLMSVPVATVAKAMVVNAKSAANEPVELFTNKDIHRMAKT